MKMMVNSLGLAALGLRIGNLVILFVNTTICENRGNLRAVYTELAVGRNEEDLKTLGRSLNSDENLHMKNSRGRKEKKEQRTLDKYKRTER